jgi:hypothetical protein
MASWAEDLNNYVKQKCHTAPPLVPIVRFTRKGVHPEVPRQFNILTNAAASEEAAIRFEEQLRLNSEKHVKRGIAREMSAANHGYNIISMQPRYGMSVEAVDQMGGNQEPKGKRSHPEYTKYNVITMEPNYSEVLEEERKENEKKHAARQPRHQRERNIISHRYVADHETRAERDETENRNRVNLIANSLAGYNPVTCKYRHKDIEDADVRSRREREEHQREVVSHHTYKVSGIVGRSEGHAYDVVSNELYNPGFVLRVQQEAMRGVPQRAFLRQAWEYQRDVEEAVRDADADRAARRISHERELAIQRRGYDVICNKPFGLSRAEEIAGKEADPIVAHESVRPNLPMDLLRQKSITEQLEENAKPKEWFSSTVLRQSGPRTSYERVFNVPPSEALGETATFEGRRRLILPALEKLSKTQSMRTFS